MGQADSILIEDSNNNTILIDASNNDSDLVVNYIKSQNISTIDYVIGTHLHEDHIGGLDAVIDNSNITNLIFTKSTFKTKTGKKHHKKNCSSLKSTTISISLENAKKSYTPCSKCNL